MLSTLTTGEKLVIAKSSKIGHMFYESSRSARIKMYDSILDRWSKIKSIMTEITDTRNDLYSRIGKEMEENPDTYTQVIKDLHGNVNDMIYDFLDRIGFKPRTEKLISELKVGANSQRLIAMLTRMRNKAKYGEKREESKGKARVWMESFESILDHSIITGETPKQNFLLSLVSMGRELVFTECLKDVQEYLDIKGELSELAERCFNNTLKKPKDVEDSIDLSWKIGSETKKGKLFMSKKLRIWIKDNVKDLFATFNDDVTPTEFASCVNLMFNDSHPIKRLRLPLLDCSQLAKGLDNVIDEAGRILGAAAMDENKERVSATAQEANLSKVFNLCWHLHMNANTKSEAALVLARLAAIVSKTPGQKQMYEELTKLGIASGVKDRSGAKYENVLELTTHRLQMASCIYTRSGYLGQMRKDENMLGQILDLLLFMFN